MLVKAARETANEMVNSNRSPVRNLWVFMAVAICAAIVLSAFTAQASVARRKSMRKPTVKQLPKKASKRVARAKKPTNLELAVRDIENSSSVLMEMPYERAQILDAPAPAPRKPSSVQATKVSIDFEMPEMKTAAEETSLGRDRKIQDQSTNLVYVDK